MSCQGLKMALPTMCCAFIFASDWEAPDHWGCVPFFGSYFVKYLGASGKIVGTTSFVKSGQSRGISATLPLIVIWKECWMNLDSKWRSQTMQVSSRARSPLFVPRPFTTISHKRSPKQGARLLTQTITATTIGYATEAILLVPPPPCHLFHSGVHAHTHTTSAQLKYSTMWLKVQATRHWSQINSDGNSSSHRSNTCKHACTDTHGSALCAKLLLRQPFAFVEMRSGWHSFQYTIPWSSRPLASASVELSVCLGSSSSSSSKRSTSIGCITQCSERKCEHGNAWLVWNEFSIGGAAGKVGLKLMLAFCFHIVLVDAFTACLSNDVIGDGVTAHTTVAPSR